MELGHVPEGRLLMTRRQTSRVEVIAIGTPPPVAVRPLVDEVLEVLAQRREPAGGSIDDSRPGQPAAAPARRTPRGGQRHQGGHGQVDDASQPAGCMRPPASPSMKDRPPSRLLVVGTAIAPFIGDVEAGGGFRDIDAVRGTWPALRWFGSRPLEPRAFASPEAQNILLTNWWQGPSSGTERTYTQHLDVARP